MTMDYSGFALLRGDGGAAYILQNYSGPLQEMQVRWPNGASEVGFRWEESADGAVTLTFAEPLAVGTTVDVFFIAKHSFGAR